MCMWLRERVRERECVFVCVCVWERERVCVRERESVCERERERVCVCVWDSERERSWSKKIESTCPNNLKQELNPVPRLTAKIESWAKMTSFLRIRSKRKGKSFIPSHVGQCWPTRQMAPLGNILYLSGKANFLFPLDEPWPCRKNGRLQSKSSWVKV